MFKELCRVIGVNDFFMYRNQAPKWMSADEKSLWLLGYNHAKRICSNSL